MTINGSFVPAIGQSLVAVIANGPSFIGVGAIAQGYQTAPEMAGDEPSEGTFSIWIPAARAVVTGNINPETVEATAAVRMATDRRFLPGRWLAQDDRRERILKTAVRSFGAGPRMCPGRYLALLEMKSVLSALFRNFEILRIASPHGRIQETMSVTMNPGPLEMRVRPFE